MFVWPSADKASFSGHIIFITGTEVQSWDMNKWFQNIPSLSWMFSDVARFYWSAKLPKILATNLNYQFQHHKILRWKQKSSFIALRQFHLWSRVTMRGFLVDWIAAHSHQPHWPFWVHHSVITLDSIHHLVYVFILFWPHQLMMSTCDYSTPWCEVSKHSSNHSMSISLIS